jgi:hypothetical protein
MISLASPDAIAGPSNGAIPLYYELDDFARKISNAKVLPLNDTIDGDIDAYLY